jgi:N-acetylmuramoyl-L-alanine amidase
MTGAFDISVIERSVMDRKVRPVRLLLTILLIASFNTAAYSRANRAEVKDIRHWSNPNYTRVVIDLSQKADFNYHLLKKDPTIKKPRRFYVDISGATLANGLKRSIPINDGLLKAVRAGQYKKDTVRVVLDIETLGDYKVFPLTNPYRIVIDVTGTVKNRTVTDRKDSSTKGPLTKRPASETPPHALEGGTAPPAGEPRKVKTIVIDPGHGGKDPGAIGKRGLKEKDITLKLSKLLKKELLKKNLDAKVILTRTRDVFIPLDERTVIANMNEADIFISIHVNASPNRKSTGVETYYLDYSHDKDALRVASRENFASTEEMDDVLQFILNDLKRSGNRIESSALATHVQGSLSSSLRKKYRGIKSNGVKGAPFYVLVNSNMPSILVEVSFLSNPRDEKRLKDEKYQQEIIKGISKGILRYVDGDRG